MIRCCLKRKRGSCFYDRVRYVYSEGEEVTVSSENK